MYEDEEVREGSGFGDVGWKMLGPEQKHPIHGTKE